ncbi:arylamine N-acetyltransferase family protein [Rhizorhabdus dicambivorans]|uniref:Acetyltransferase n=1 Tax=Rhizorhabdus dicambivorans TaxID=1850238 RepID=A0A2A4FW64_9SPHN|nr:arylamine N-acetyltransferase [Rhizorhabdus dicambivorans]ATE65579.1 acetyltransferase [Rhizorhabdus dicambivorans]PCE41922.1 acetyltransferase [Rhizorhabdus dicambivorans]
MPVTPSLDLDAYLTRIGLKLAPDADAAGLHTIQRAHRLSIPFENLDIRLGRGISLDPDHVFDKLVVRRRGGYCFEQNQLFLRALAAMGFDARPLLARVWLFTADVPPRTHTLNLVTIEGRPWIADAGFGGSYTPPMPLADGAEGTSPDGAHFRLLQSDDLGWLLERRAAPDADWEAQYSFTLDQVVPADLELSNHWTATRPDTRFTSLSVVSLCLPSGLAALTDRHYSRRNGDQHVEADIESAKAYRLRLNFVFGIILDEVEVMGLGLY